MNKKLLFTLPLMAAVLASCGSKKKASDVVPDPDKGEEVAVNVATEKLLASYAKTFDTNAIGVSFGASVNANAKANIPLSSSGTQVTFAKASANGSLTSFEELNVANIDKAGIKNLRASGAVSTKFNYEVKMDEEFGIDLGEYASMNKDMEANAYFDGKRGYFDWNQDLVDMAKLIGGKEFEGMPNAGKYRTPEIPESEELDQIVVKDYISTALEGYKDQIASYVQMGLGMASQFVDKVTGIKFSDTEYAVYLEADVFKTIGKLAPYIEELQAFAQYLTMFDENDVATLTAGFTYDTNKGIESIGIDLVLDLDVTFLDYMKAMGVTEEQAKQIYDNSTLNTKMVEVEADATVSFVLSTGKDVKVKELSESAKGDYKDFPTTIVG